MEKVTIQKADVKRYKEASKVLSENIPPELSGLRQWVGWVGKPQSGSTKLDKIPINPMSGRAASSTDPKTWGNFEQAMAWYQSQLKRRLFIGGIGFVFSEDDLYCGVDLDHCRDSETGVFRDWPEVLLQKLNSYTEVSPSLEGVKVFCKAKKLKSIKKDNIEVYFTARFFTVTGRWVGDYSGEVEDRSDEILSLYESLQGSQKKSSGGAQDAGDSWFEWAMDGVGESQRHDIALRLACRWKVKALSDSEIISMLISWNEKNHPPKPSLSDPESKEFRDIVSYSNEKHGVVGFEWEDPVLLDDFSLPKMEPLPGIIGEFSQAVSAAAETPLELAQGLALAAVATACQGKVEVQVKRGYSEPVNVWINVALKSGNRKSSVHAEVTRPLLSWEAEKREEMALEVAVAESQRKNQEARLKSLRGKYGKAKREDLEEIEAEIEELEAELVEVPVVPKVWVQDVTVEHLGTLLILTRWEDVHIISRGWDL